MDDFLAMIIAVILFVLTLAVCMFMYRGAPDIHDLTRAYLAQEVGITLNEEE